MGPIFILHGCNHEPRMSALGHKRTFRLIHSMSALPPKADINAGTVSPDVADGSKHPLGSLEDWWPMVLGTGY
jgi:hypothetical protein